RRRPRPPRPSSAGAAWGAGSRGRRRGFIPLPLRAPPLLCRPGPWPQPWRSWRGSWRGGDALWSALPQYKKKITDRCFHHSECYSGCCLMDLESGGAFCAPRARITMICLPQTKGATNIICPCRVGLTCISKDLMCASRCHMI
uniref:Colipase-like protein 2 n=1 Tax=Macaca fascicularis TaxID=9541 RepID=A0A2K5WSQ8_MACFA